MGLAESEEKTSKETDADEFNGQADPEEYSSTGQGTHAEEACAEAGGDSEDPDDPEQPDSGSEVRSRGHEVEPGLKGKPEIGHRDEPAAHPKARTWPPSEAQAPGHLGGSELVAEEHHDGEDLRRGHEDPPQDNLPRGLINDWLCREALLMERSAPGASCPVELAGNLFEADRTQQGTPHHGEAHEDKSKSDQALSGFFFAGQEFRKFGVGLAKGLELLGPALSVPPPPGLLATGVGIPASRR